MHSQFQLLDAICGWCSDATECVAVQFENGSAMDLCWKCLRSKAKAEAKHVAKRLGVSMPESSLVSKSGTNS
jgi:hypothetical protein